MEIREWQRQKGESSKSFIWFKIYRNIGPTRTLKNTLKKMEKNMEKCGNIDENLEEIVPTPTFAQLTSQSSRWDWSERARAYDNYQDQLEIQAKNEAYKQTEKDLLEIANDFQKLIKKNVKELKQDTTSQTISKSHALKSVASAIDKTTKNIRLLHGKPTDIKDNKLEANIDADVEVTENITRLTSSELDVLLTINDNEEEFKDKL